MWGRCEERVQGRSEDRWLDLVGCVSAQIDQHCDQTFRATCSRIWISTFKWRDLKESKAFRSDVFPSLCYLVRSQYFFEGGFPRCNCKSCLLASQSWLSGWSICEDYCHNARYCHTSVKVMLQCGSYILRRRNPFSLRRRNPNSVSGCDFSSISQACSAWSDGTGAWR